MEDNNKVNSRKNKLLSLTSAIIGGVISAIIVVVLFANHIIPINNSNDNNSVVSANKKDAPFMEEMVTSESDIPTNLDELSKSIVGIINMQQQNVWTPSEEVGSGSGIIYKKEDEKAYIVTNNHVVKGAEEVEVDFNNDERIKAKVIGTDELSDLAVLEIDGSKVEFVADLGSSEELQIGETVITIGNPLGVDFSGSVTKGIISGLDRSIEVDTNGDSHPDWITEVIQTDAAINPGNSGGALVNSNGEVIGINSMKIALQEVEGIGFAIPIDAALPVIEQLETKGEITRPFIGISTVNINQVPVQYRDKMILPENSEGGMVVADVQAESPAANAGLKQFDIITKINAQRITSMLDLRKYMYSEVAIGDTIKIEVYRDGKEKIIDMKLTERDM